MGYSIEISINLLKETKFSEIEKTVTEVAELYMCDNIYSLEEDDIAMYLPRHHLIFVVNFLETNNNFIQFVKFAKKYKPVNIECIYNDYRHKLLYASSLYLKNIDKNIANKYKYYLKDGQFSDLEALVLKELM